MKKYKKIELLAPAGNLEKMKTALVHGADAVYAGIPDFSLRVRINDFDLDKIREAVEYCHSHDKKLYITVNIFAHNEHIDKLPDYITKLKDIGVDALIVSDPGIISLIREVWSEAEIHLSTQANCTNWRSAKFWFDIGVKRVILGREVTLEEIKEIREKVPDLDLEYFVHGAMCMSYSGRCFLSKYYLDRSGNLGDCIQPCRWKYDVSQKSIKSKVESQNEEGVFISEEKRPDEVLEIVEEEHGSYILNSKDMCMIEYLQDLADAGVMSFKIEGRAKSAYYQAVVAGIYSRVTRGVESGAKEDIDFLKNELNTKIINRGYTTGFLLGYEKMREAEGQDITSSHNNIDWEFCGQVIRSEKLEGGSKKFRIGIKVHNTLRVDDEVEVVMPGYEVLVLQIDKMYNDKEEEIKEAHGGSGKIIFIEVDVNIPEFSVLRRKI